MEKRTFIIISVFLLASSSLLISFMFELKQLKHKNFLFSEILQEIKKPELLDPNKNVYQFSYTRNNEPISIEMSVDPNKKILTLKSKNLTYEKYSKPNSITFIDHDQNKSVYPVSTFAINFFLSKKEEVKIYIFLLEKGLDALRSYNNIAKSFNLNNPLPSHTF